MTLPKVGDRCPCGIGPEHFYDTYDVLRMQTYIDDGTRDIAKGHARRAMTPQVQHAIDCYAGRKCKDPLHAN